MYATSIKCALLLGVLAMPSEADIFEVFGAGAGERWVYVADGVMGGVSTGQAVVADGAVRLTGQVSTENNGGFIQVRHRFGGGWPAEAAGLKLRVKGNGATYYVFLRTAGLARPWYSYRQPFETSTAWLELELPFDGFTAARPEMPQSFTPDQVVSIGLVAYGADFAADLTVDQIELYKRRNP